MRKYLSRSAMLVITYMGILTLPSQLKNPSVNPPDANLDLMASSSVCLHGMGTTFESYFHGSSDSTDVTNSFISR